MRIRKREKAWALEQALSNGIAASPMTGLRPPSDAPWHGTAHASRYVNGSDSFPSANGGLMSRERVASVRGTPR